ncbi:MAG: hypothetical protein EOP04_13615 [Proteobacteria bacterium]|nr:MAG: hypothetical protein EOP04_13615 [Pseudomonadota bacterium]
MKLLSFFCVVLTVGLGAYWSWEIFTQPNHPEKSLTGFATEPPSTLSGYHSQATQGGLLEVAHTDSIVRRSQNKADVRSPAVDPEATISEEVLHARETYVSAFELTRKDEQLAEYLPGEGMNRMLRTYLLMAGVSESQSKEAKLLRDYWERGLAKSTPQAVERLSKFLEVAPLELQERSYTVTLLTWMHHERPESQPYVETALMNEIGRSGPTPQGLRALSVLLSMKSDPSFKQSLERRLASKFSDKGWGRYLASESGQ